MSQKRRNRKIQISLFCLSLLAGILGGMHFHGPHNLLGFMNLSGFLSLLIPSAIFSEVLYIVLKRHKEMPRKQIEIRDSLVEITGAMTVLAAGLGGFHASNLSLIEFSLAGAIGHAVAYLLLFFIPVYLSIRLTKNWYSRAVVAEIFVFAGLLIWTMISAAYQGRAPAAAAAHAGMIDFVRNMVMHPIFYIPASLVLVNQAQERLWMKVLPHLKRLI